MLALTIKPGSRYCLGERGSQAWYRFASGPAAKPPARMLCIRGKPGTIRRGKLTFPYGLFPGFLGPEALKPSVIPARQAELGCLSQQSYFAGCGSRDEARTAACGGCSVRAEISRNEQSRHEGELRRLRLRILRTLVGVWGEQPQRNPQVY